MAQPKESDDSTFSSISFLFHNSVLHMDPFLMKFEETFGDDSQLSCTSLFLDRKGYIKGLILFLEKMDELNPNRVLIPFMAHLKKVDTRYSEGDECPPLSVWKQLKADAEKCSKGRFDLTGEDFKSLTLWSLNAMIPEIDKEGDKAAHMGAFALVSCLILTGFFDDPGEFSKKLCHIHKAAETFATNPLPKLDLDLKRPLKEEINFLISSISS